MITEANIWIIIAVVTIVQGFILSSAIMFKSKQKNAASKLLSLFILLISLSLIGRLLPFADSQFSYIIMSVLIDFIIFSFGPLSFYYLKYLFEGTYHSSKKDLLHFIPMVIFIIYLLLKFLELPLYFEYRKAINLFLELFAIVVNGLYIIIARLLVKSYQKKSENEHSFLPQIKYINIFLNLISIILVCWFYGLISKQFPILNVTTLFTYNFIWVSISSLTFLFAYFSFFESDILSIPEKQNKYEQG